MSAIERLKSVETVEDRERKGGERKLSALDRLRAIETVEERERRASATGYDALRYRPDFAEYAAKGAAIENPTMGEAEGLISFGPWKLGEKKVGNIVTYSRENLTPEKLDPGAMASGRLPYTVGDVRYLHMTDDEVGIYNYLLAKSGETAAGRYLESIDEELNRRKGGEIAAGMDKMSTAGKVFSGAVIGASAGAERAVTGIAQLFDDTPKATTAAQFAGAGAREKLGEVGPKVLGQSVGQMAYDLSNTAGNMAPSILLSAVTAGAGAPAAVAGAIGSASMGASAGGNAYAEARKEGYDEGQARTYGVLVGASEGALQYVLGGIGKLGGLSSKVTKSVANIDGALRRIAMTAGVKMFSEGSEEALQSYLEPLYRKLLFDEEYRPLEVSEEAAYSFLLGALSAGVMDGADIVRGDVAQSRAMRELGEANFGRVTARRDMISSALAGDKKSNAYKLAKRLEAGKGSQNKQNERFGRLLMQTGADNVAKAEAARTDAADSDEVVDGNGNIAKTKNDDTDILKTTGYGKSGITGEPVSSTETIVPQDGRDAKGESSAGVDMGNPLPRVERDPAAEAVLPDARENVEPMGAELPHVAEETVSAEMRAEVDRLRRITGRRIELERPTHAGQNGRYDPTSGVIYISTETQNPVAKIVAHELTHSAEIAGSYRDLEQYVTKMYNRRGEDLAQAKAKKIAAYAKSGVTLDDAGAMNEIVAEYFEGMMTNEAEVKKFVRYHHTIGQRVIEFFERLLAKIPAAREYGRERAQLREAKRIWSAAYREAVEAGESTWESDDVALFQDMVESGEMSQERYDELVESGSKYSIERTQGGKPVVVIEEDILAGVPRRDWVKTVKANLKEKFPNGISVGRENIKVNAQSRNELLNSEYTKALRKSSGEVYADKLRMTNNADEIVLAAEDWVGESPKHARADNLREFARATARIRIGGRLYDAEVVVGTMRSGDAVLYDIVGIENKNEARLPVSRSQEGELSLDRGKSGSKDSIPQSDADVNPLTENILPMVESGEMSQERYDEPAESGSKYSIERSQEGGPIVVIEEDILAGVPERDWTRTVKDRLKENFPNGITVGRENIDVTQRETGREVTNSKHARFLRNADRAVYGDKLRATNNADEILRAADGWVGEELQHDRKDRIKEFARAKVLIRVGGNEYNADVLVGTRDNGSAVLHDIRNLTKVSRKEADPNRTSATQLSAYSRLFGSASADSVPQSDADVNPLTENILPMVESGEMSQERYDEPAESGSKYSIERSQEGGPIVVIEEDILAGVPRRDWVKTVKANLKEKFPNGISVGRENIKVNAQSRSELTNSEYTKELRKSSGEAYVDKLRMTNNADEIVLAAENWVGEKPKHARADGLREFARATTQIRIGERLYDAEVVVGTMRSGDAVLYDIVGLENKNEARLPQEPLSRKRELSSDTGKSGSVDSVPQSDADVNPLTENILPMVESGRKIRYSIDENYAEDLDRWEKRGRPNGEVFILGETGEVLQGLGAMEQELYLRSEKVNTILETHPEMTMEEIKRIPEILDDPVLMMKSRNVDREERQNTRLVMYGTVRAKDGRPALAVLDLKPVEQGFVIDDMQKVTSVYTKDSSPVQFVESSEILYADEKKTIPLLRTIGFQMPIELLRYGSVGSISYERQNVKISGKNFYEMIKAGESDETPRYSITPEESADAIVQAAEEADADGQKADAPSPQSMLGRSWRKSIDKSKSTLIKRAAGISGASAETMWEAIGTKVNAMVDGYLRDGKVDSEMADALFQDMVDHGTTVYREQRQAFDEALGEMVADLYDARDEYLSLDASREDNQTARTVTDEAYRDAQDKIGAARKNAERIAEKNRLGPEGRKLIDALLKGSKDVEQTDGLPNRAKILAVYEAKKEVRRLEDIIDRWNKQRQGKLAGLADSILEGLTDEEKWKDKKAGWMYARETMERNFRDVVKDQVLAERIIATYFTPVHEENAKALRYKNAMRDRVRQLGLSRKAAAGNKMTEAAIVQAMGEAQDNINVMREAGGRMLTRGGRTLEQWVEVIDKITGENPNTDWGKITHAIEEFRAIYDELFKQMNEVRVRNGYAPIAYRRGYFPHFSEGEDTGLLSLFGKALGVSTSVDALPTTINGITHTFKPGIRYMGNTLERKGFDTVFDSVEGFDRYIEGAADVIYQTDNIQRLRALSRQIRYKAGDDGIKEQIREIERDATLNEDQRQSAIEQIKMNGRFALSNLVVELDEYTNLLANKKSRADRTMEQMMGRDAYRLCKALENRVAANMVAINLGSWLTNYVPLTQGLAGVGGKNMLLGMWRTIRAYKSGDGVVDESVFLTNRRGSDPLVRTWSQGASAVLSKPMELFIDQFVADSLVRARLLQKEGEGLSRSDAMRDADAWAASLMGDRSKGAQPTMFAATNPLTKLFTQFQLEVNNQLGYVFKDVPRDMKDKGLGALAVAYIKMFVGALIFNELFEKLVGRRPAMDPLGVLLEIGHDAVESDGFGDGVRAVTQDILDNVADNLPFMGAFSMLGLDESLGIDIDAGRLPIESAMPNLGTIGKALTTDDWSARKRVREIGEELAKPAAYLLAPFGGGQLKKIFGGLEAVINGGSYTLDADGQDKLQYPVYRGSVGETVGNAVKAMVFGKTSLSTAQEWIEGGFGTFGAKETAAYQGMLDAGVSDREAFALINQIRGAEKSEGESQAKAKRRILRESTVSAIGKSVVYYALMAKDSERKMLDGMADTETDIGEVSRVLLEVRDGADIWQEVYNARIDDGDRMVLYEELLSESKYKKLKAARENGISIEAYVDVQQVLPKFDENGNKSYTQAEITAALDSFGGGNIGDFVLPSANRSGMTLTRAQKAILWQVLTGSGKAENNPYDVEVARRVIGEPVEIGGIVLPSVKQ